ncbi:MmcQ/YjbR family DNA-binding protein [Aquihabitans sp. G128]|uniref:MmcQ/YjbR family DNA-binding protein n=1 Tax=Aquihabitans sp. G128 TaxID=2849779 RepID=UPI001C239538|nr:MmcQ/YjbR family DNA-binding protein [Aquihabitans sp. G128]QXC61444.1 MmcQ/YjbR family DNA-binding protein [Aquihabitans sp. G128]
MGKRYDPEAVRDRLRAFALALPDSVLEHPWDSDVVKTNGGKKIFVFLGHNDPEYPPQIGVKLVESHEQALQGEGAEPSGYGLGKAGWVSIKLRAGAPPVGVLEDWVEESYRQVALKRNVKELDARGA